MRFSGRFSLRESTGKWVPRRGAENAVSARDCRYSALIPANPTTLAHFSVSSKILVTRVNGKMGSSTRGRKRSICKRLPLLRLDTREPHHLSPFLGFLGDELGEVGRRAGKYLTAEFCHS